MTINHLINKNISEYIFIKRNKNKLNITIN